jgi:hypothetical protein
MWEMSHDQLHEYLKKHEGRVRDLFLTLERRGGKDFPEYRFFQDLLDGYQIMDALYQEHDKHFRENVERWELRVENKGLGEATAFGAGELP